LEKFKNFRTDNVEQGGRDSYHRVLVSGPKIYTVIDSACGKTGARSWRMVDAGAGHGRGWPK